MKGSLTLTQSLSHLEKEVSENYRTWSSNRIYEVISTLGVIQHHSTKAKALINFLRKYSTEIASEVKEQRNSLHAPYYPCEKVIIAFLRSICNNSCNRLLLSICTKIMLNLGYCEYKEEKRFRFKVYSMTAHKDGDIKKLLNDMHFAHCEEDGLSSSDETNDVPNTNLCKGQNDSSISSNGLQTDKVLGNNSNNHISKSILYPLDTVFRSVISEEIQRVFIQDLLPVLKQLISSSIHNNNSSFDNKQSQKDTCSLSTGSPNSCASKPFEDMDKLNDCSIAGMPSIHQCDDHYSCQTTDYGSILGGIGMISSDIADENLQSLSQSIIAQNNSCSKNDNRLSNETIYFEI